MPDDFAAAATRHFLDGSLLEAKRRIGNADQLFGFAAECGIKTALAGLPGSVQSGSLTGEYKKHIKELWHLAQVQGIQKRYPNLVKVLRMTPPFDDWSTDQRYGPDGSVTTQILARHREAARRVLGSVGLSGTRGEV